MLGVRVRRAAGATGRSGLVLIGTFCARYTRTKAVASPSPPSPLPRRLYPKLLAGLFVLVALLSLSLVALGLQEVRSLRHLVTAGVLIAAGSACWEIIERRVRDHTAPAGFAAWIALPLSIALAFAAIPLLLLAAYPPLVSFLAPAERVTARIVDGAFAGTALVVRFPAPLRAGGFNLTLDGRALPVTLRDDDAVVTWRNPRTVVLLLQPLLARIGGPAPKHVGVNTLADAPKFVAKGTGDTVLPQQVVVGDGP